MQEELFITVRGCDAVGIDKKQAKEILILIKKFLLENKKSKHRVIRIIGIHTNLKQLIEEKMKLKKTTTYRLLEKIKEKIGSEMNSFYFTNSEQQCNVANIIQHTIIKKRRLNEKVDLRKNNN